MRSTIVRKIILGLIAFVSIFFSVGSQIHAAEPKKQGTSVLFVKPITADPQRWVADQAEAGKDIYLSANYLFQVTKLRSQDLLIHFESETLYPTLIEVMDGMKAIGFKGDALIFVEMARKLLDPAVSVNPEVAADVDKRLTDFYADPQNDPRGHYASTEELKKYFRGMQFLTKATFDVKVDKRWFSQRLYMLFPFEAAVDLMTSLSDPKKQDVRDKLNQVHVFYDGLVGRSDLPSFHDLFVDEVALSPRSVLAYAKQKGLPQINKEMGVGIQCLGERFSDHQLIIERLSARFLARDIKVNRKKAFEVLRFENVLLGRKIGKAHVRGLVSQNVDSSNPNTSYYALCLGSLLNVPGTKATNYSKNTSAACLTALAEQTILVTKRTTLVPKSAAPLGENTKKPVNIYVQAGIATFLNYLSNAEERLSSACRVKSATDMYQTLIKASAGGQPIKSDSAEGVAVLDLVANLPLDPTATADVFYFAGRSDKGFLQWAIAPFEAEYTLPDKTKARGMEMVFFEGWHDTARPGAKYPMNNEGWNKLFAQGDYKKFRSFLEVP